MRRPARIFSALLGSVVLLASCDTQDTRVYLELKGQVYPSAAAYRAAYTQLLDMQVAAVTPVADRIGGSALVVLPDADRLRPMVANVYGVNPSSGTTKAEVEFFQVTNRAVADAIRRGNLFDSVQVVEQNDTESPANPGYDYIIWYQVGTTGANHTGAWFGKWQLRRGADPATETLGFDPGVSDQDRLLGMIRLIRPSAAKLGGPALPNGLSPGGGTVTGSLSGVAVSGSGDIVTSHQGVNGCSSMRVQTPSFTLPASILARDRQNDLALLHVDHNFAVPAIFRDGASIREAEPVVTIGYPLSGVLASDGVVTNGSISALTGVRDDTRFLQFTAPIQPGNSGGPLLDASGHVVGLVSGKLDVESVGGTAGGIPQNVNFALKSAVVREFLDIHDVKYRSAPSSAQLRSADIAEQVKQAVVHIECLK